MSSRWNIQFKDYTLKTVFLSCVSTPVIILISRMCFHSKPFDDIETMLAKPFRYVWFLAGHSSMFYILHITHRAARQKLFQIFFSNFFQRKKKFFLFFFVFWQWRHPRLNTLIICRCMRNTKSTSIDAPRIANSFL